MSELGVLFLVAGAVTVAGFARRRGWPAPLVVVLVGLLVSELPHMPHVEIDPDLVLDVILPPLLYSAAQESSYLSIRRNTPADRAAVRRAGAVHHGGRRRGGVGAHRTA